MILVYMEGSCAQDTVLSYSAKGPLWGEARNDVVDKSEHTTT